MKLVHISFKLQYTFVYISLRTNPLARSLGQVKLVSGKWKLWKN